MRNALPIALILLAVAVGAWIFLSGEEPLEPGDIGDLADGPLGDDPDLMRSGELKGSGSAPTPRPERRSYKPVDPSTVARGQLDVLPVGPDLSPIPNQHLKVYVDSVGLKDWAKRLAHYDPETGIWSFQKVLAGEVEVRIFGDHVIETKQKATVKADRSTRVQVHVELAGAIHYKAKLRSGGDPGDVTISLLDGNEEPVAAYHESRGARRINTPRKTTSSVQGSEGAVFGLPAGRYRLRVDTEDHGYKDVVVDVEVSSTQKVTVELGR